MEEIRKLLKKGETPEYILQTLVTSMDSAPEPDVKTRERHRSVVNLPTFLKKSESVCKRHFIIILFIYLSC